MCLGTGSVPASSEDMHTCPRQGDILIAPSSHFQATAQRGPGWAGGRAGFLVLFLFPKAILIRGARRHPDSEGGIQSHQTFPVWLAQVMPGSWNQEFVAVLTAAASLRDPWLTPGSLMPPVIPTGDHGPLPEQ